MTVNIALEEYELLLSFKNQLKEKNEEYFHVLKEKEKKEKEVIDLINFYKNEKNKNIKQLLNIEEEILKCSNVLDNFKEQTRKELKLLNSLEAGVCVYKEIVIERSLKK